MKGIGYLVIFRMQSRIESENGLSYQELSYQILQAVDFCRLYEIDSVNTQVWHIANSDNNCRLAVMINGATSVPVFIWQTNYSDNPNS